MNKKNILRSSALTLSLCLLVPYIFFWSNNWHMYSLTSLGFCAGLLILASLLLFALASTVKFIFVRYLPFFSTATRQLTIDMVILACGVFLLPFLLSETLEISSLLYKFLISFGLLILFLFLYIVSKGRFPNLLLLAWLGIASVSLVYGIMFERGNDIQGLTTKIVFKNKPNVYLFILESYQNLDTLENIYGIDTTDFKNFLTRNNFTHYPDVYSNSSATLVSMADIFSLQSLKDWSRGNADVAPPIRNLIGGDQNNFVTKTFKENGYLTESIYPGTYYMFKQGSYLDKTNLALNSFGDHQLNPLFLINKTLTKWKDKHRLPWLHAAKLKWQNSLEHLLQTKEQGQPYFVTIKAGADHSPRNHLWKDAKNWVNSEEYQKKITDSQKDLLPFIDRLAAADPSAIIIMIGDHGAWRFRRIFESAKVETQQDFDNWLAEIKVTKKDLANDFFGTFCAIRHPGQKSISHGYAMSHRNLFWHIFAELAQNKNLLVLRSPSISVFSKYTLVFEGKFDNIDNLNK